MRKPFSLSDFLFRQVTGRNDYIVDGRWGGGYRKQVFVYKNRTAGPPGRRRGKESLLSPTPAWSEGLRLVVCTHGAIATIVQKSML